MPKIFTVALFGFCIGLSCCNRTPDTARALSVKIANFEKYSQAVNQCTGADVDSVLRCTQSVIQLDTVKAIDRSVWEAYAKARVRFRNNLGAEAIEVIDDILPLTENPALMFERAELLVLRSSITVNSHSMQMTAEDLYRAADLYQQLGLARKASSCYIGIANLQYNVANYALAIDNGLRAIDLLHKISPMVHEDSIQLMQVYNTLGLGYYKQNNIDSAQQYYDSAYTVATMLNEEFWQGLIRGNAADIYLAKGRVREAIESYKNDIQTSLKFNESASAALSLLSIGAIYVSNRELEIGRQYYDSAYTLLLKAGRPISLSRYYYLMAEWFEIKKDSDHALEYYKKHVVYRDSVQSIRINSQLQQIQSQKSLEKQLTDITLLKTENELKEKELTISRISIGAFLVVSLLLAGLLYSIRRSNKQLSELNQALETKVRSRTERLRKINSELDTYLYRASHDVRRPILTILGLVHIASLTNEVERGKIIDSIQKTAHEMDKMLRKLQMAYELEKEDKGNRTMINVNHYLKLRVAELQKEYPGTSFEIIEGPEIIVNSNLDLIHIIVMNILENACIFSKEDDHRVTITISNRDGYAHILIKDHGIGIEPEFIVKIFDAYVRCSNRSTGSGLGLHLARKAAKLIGGKITATSTINDGSEFLVTIPVK